MTNSTDRGLIIGPLKAIRRVLRKWQTLNEEKFWFERGDAPWWYTERATLSLFAGAVWLCGGRALEEFSIMKATATKPGQTNYKDGRCDIEFSIGESEFIAEAKRCWLTLSGSTQNIRQSVENCITQANQEALRLPELDGYQRLGIAFVVPQVHISKQEAIDQYLEAFIAQLLSIEDTTMAWVFPKVARRLHPPAEESTSHNYIFPGVVVLLGPV